MATANLESRRAGSRSIPRRPSNQLHAAPPGRVERGHELRLAAELAEAREELWSLLLALPEEARAHVLTSAEPVRRRARRCHTHEQIETAFARLLGYEASAGDPQLEPLVARARSLHRSIERAREDLVLVNLYLVSQVVRQYRAGPIPVSDLLQEGYIGLLQAVDRFDATRGYRFATYAVWWIRRAMLEAFSQRSRMIRLPDSLREDLRFMRRTEEELERDLGRAPHPPELAARMKVSLRKVRKLMDVAPEPTAIEDLLAGGKALSDRPAPDPFERTLSLELQGQARQALLLLDSRERTVIRLRYGFEGEMHTLAEIGALIGLSRERVRQIESSALDRIHSWAVTRGLQSARAV